MQGAQARFSGTLSSQVPREVQSLSEAEITVSQPLEIRNTASPIPLYSCPTTIKKAKVLILDLGQARSERSAGLFNCQLQKPDPAPSSLQDISDLPAYSPEPDDSLRAFRDTAKVLGFGRVSFPEQGSSRYRYFP